MVELKYFIKGALGLIAFVSLSADGWAGETLRMSHSYETSEAFHTTAVEAAEEIFERTQGRYEIDIFPSAQLGGERDVEDAMRFGGIHLALIGAGHAAQTYPPVALHLAAFLWDDYEHFMRYPGSDVFKEITSGYESASGNKVLALTYYGQRHVTSNKPILHPDDMKGLKIRVPPARVYELFPRAVGANPTPIAFAELYLALQQKVVDAQENPLPTIRAKRFYEVQSHINLTGHITDGLFTLVSERLWKRLSAQDQEIFATAFKRAADRAGRMILQEENSLIPWFEERGITVNQVDRAAFRAAVIEGIRAKSNPWTADHVDAVLALAKAPVLEE